ncbi:MAG TPA: hypothetical protein VK120_00410 [Sporosarcina sp.]|nr:hypothetical protein [Sporosarcina sp.]
MKVERHFGKVGVFTGIVTFVLLVVGLRNIIGQQVEVMNFIAFVIFGLIIGIIFATMLFYKLNIAVSIFTIAYIVGFFDMFRSFIANPDEQGGAIGILSLFIFTSFGLGLSLFIEFGIRLFKKEQKSS